MYTNNKLSKAVRLAIAFGAASATAFTASVTAAEEDESAKVERIEVTGSRIKRADMEGANPVTVLDRVDIERFGLTSIGDVLQNIPAAGSAINTNSNNGGNGTTTLNIRGLGSNRTLVLVDGKRWAPGLGGSVDLNNIPSAIIERIEVLKDGASAVYGSDAVAGVVNIITRKDFDGVHANLYAGEYASEGDGRKEAYDIGFGTTSEKGSVYFNVSYVNEAETLAGDREISAVPIFGTPEGFGGSSGTPNTRFAYVDDEGTFVNAQGDGNGGLIPWTASSPFNFAPFNYLSTPQERINLFSQAQYELSDSLQVNVSATYNNRKSAQALAPTPLFIGSAFGDTGYILAANNPYNPTGLDLSTDTPGENELYLVGRRMMESGFRQFNQNVDQFQFNAGFEGNFELGDRFFYWDVGYTFADITQNEQTTGLLNMGNVKTAIGDVNVCNDTPGCVPLDLFGGSTAIGVGSITQEMLDYIEFVAQDASSTSMRNYTANISGDVFELPAGMMGFAAGYEKRWHKGYDLPDAFIAAGLSSGNARQPTSGAFDVDEMYLELAIPLLADVAFARNLDLELATRYSDYSNFGNTTNSKVGLKWRVNDDLMVRATYSESFRAPSISELFLGNSDSFVNLVDPCNGGAAVNSDKPGCAGIPAGYQQPNPQIRTTVGGNQNLQAEEGESVTYGFVYNPSWADGLSVTFDVFDVTIDGAVSGVGAQNILDACAGDGQTLCSLVQRNSSGAVVDLFNGLVNLGGAETRGMDANIAYRMDSDFGTFVTRLDLTYIDKRNDIIVDPVSGLSTVDELAGQAFDRDVIPRVRSNFSVDWALNDWTASYMVRFIKGTDEVCNFGNTAAQNAQEQLLCSMPSAEVGGASRNHLGSMAYHDASVGYQLTDNVRVLLGVNNLFDTDPRVSYSTFANSFDPSMYEIPGRFVYGRISMQF
tara:strand:+ start:948 stop:3749 length:2802 start_codon:yes stop_codon:yes gene_type:complete